MNQPEDTSARELSGLNLAYLMLAQRMLRQDRAAAMHRLGMTTEAADLIMALTSTQAVTLAGSNYALCAFNLDDISVARALTKPHLQGHEQVHLAILFASRSSQERLAA